jgi:hypothetical protein
MRGLLFLVALLVAALIATPVAADPKPGRGGGPPWSREGGSREGGPPWSRGHGSATSDDGNGPPAGPGNSGAAHWCKLHFNDKDAEHQFDNHGQCVSFYAQQRQLNQQEDADDEEDVSDNSGGTQLGDLQIMDVKIRTDGTFRVRGVGAESLVVVDATRDGVVAYGEATPDASGDWSVEGTWACQNGGDRTVRLEAHDANERDRQSVSFPCDDLHT